MDNLKQLSIDDILNNEELQVEEIQDIKQPSLEEQIRMATEELERNNNDFTQQIYYKEQECRELRAAMQSQEETFNRVIAGLCITIFGGRQ